MNDRIEVKISGLNLTRLIKKIIAENIMIENLVHKNKSVKFIVHESEFEKLKKICAFENKKIEIVNKTGFKSILKRVPYLFGAIVAITICFAYMFSFSSIVHGIDIELNGEIEYNLSSVKTTLSQNGVVAGMRRGSVNTKDIENMLLLKVDDIEACTVRLSGGRLQVVIYPLIKKFEPNTENLISGYSGIILNAEAYSGKLKVKAGDIVKVGDVLIENDGGAEGKVQAKVYFTSSRIYNEKQTEINYTGRYIAEKEYYLKNKLLFKKTNSIEFSKYLVKKCDFYLMSNFFIPLSCREIRYYEIEVNEKIVPFENVESEIKNQLYLEAKTSIPENVEEGTITYSVVREGTYVRIDCFIETVIDLI